MSALSSARWWNALAAMWGEAKDATPGQLRHQGQDASRGLHRRLQAHLRQEARARGEDVSKIDLEPLIRKVFAQSTKANVWMDSIVHGNVMVRIEMSCVVAENAENSVLCPSCRGSGCRSMPLAPSGGGVSFASEMQTLLQLREHIEARMVQVDQLMEREPVAAKTETPRPVVNDGSARGAHERAGRGAGGAGRSWLGA